MKKLVMSSTMVGMALFSLNFGAGNIIFPPYVGLGSGPEWLLGFFCYYMADIGLALLAILAMVKAGTIDRPEGLFYRLRGRWAKIMMGAVLLCIGPMLAIPRTGATTYQMVVQPLLGEPGTLSLLITTLIYFGLVYALAIRESKLVDIVGKYLTPALVVGLLALIVAGVMNPLGPISETPMLDNVVWEGISSGYQTLDVLGCMVWGFVIVSALKAKGYTSDKHKALTVILACLAAGVIFLIIYGGLCYLGATVSTIYPLDYDRGTMIIEIADKLFGQAGSLVLGIVVSLACLTTGTGLAGGCGTFFYSLSDGKLSYKTIVTLTCIFSCVVANFGLNKIISMAVPVLVIIYPAALVIVVLSFFNKQINNDNIIKFATGGALLVSTLEVLNGFGLPLGFVTKLPLSFYGFAWVLPAAVAGVIGYFFKAKPVEDDLATA